MNRRFLIRLKLLQLFLSISLQTPTFVLNDCSFTRLSYSLKLQQKACLSFPLVFSSLEGPKAMISELLLTNLNEIPGFLPIISTLVSQQKKFISPLAYFLFLPNLPHNMTYNPTQMCHKMTHNPNLPQKFVTTK